MKYYDYLESVLKELRELEECLENSTITEKTRQLVKQNFLCWYIMEADEIVSIIDFSKFPELNKMLKESEKELQTLKSIIEQATAEESEDTVIIDVEKLLELLLRNNDK